MYSREEAKRIKQEFWTALGQYMLAVPFADGERLNWMNYKTGVKHLFFRMDANHKRGTISIDITHSDAGLRALLFEQFKQYKTMLHTELEEEWEWQELFVDEYGKEITRIYRQIDHVNIHRKEDWSTLISFFKPRIIALDGFWSMAKDSFDVFR